MKTRPTISMRWQVLLCILAGIGFGMLFGVGVDDVRTGLLSGTVFGGLLLVLFALLKFGDD